MRFDEWIGQLNAPANARVPRRAPCPSPPPSTCRHAYTLLAESIATKKHPRPANQARHKGVAAPVSVAPTSELVEFSSKILFANKTAWPIDCPPTKTVSVMSVGARGPLTGVWLHLSIQDARVSRGVRPREMGPAQVQPRSVKPRQFGSASSSLTQAPKSKLNAA